ncbi:MAG: hypothetical protein SPF62_07740 [Prevotella sp.]|nr:hypothetical protein [Prevotella sp.]MDY5547200.1 hypothetical protein [Prevotella sp.]
MPYRRLPKTDTARLKTLKTLLGNDSIYTARERFLDWKVLNSAQPLYDRLLTAAEQYRMCFNAQVRNSDKIDKLQRRATMYVSHFLQVLFMTIERGEIKRPLLSLYGLDEAATALPAINTMEGLGRWAEKTIEGEKQRIARGGRPIYNPTIGMVATHYDIFREAYQAQRLLQERTQRAQDELKAIRPEVDAVILELWNQIEAHYADLPAEERFKAATRLGVVYYNRRNEHFNFKDDD